MRVNEIRLTIQSTFLRDLDHVAMTNQLMIQLKTQFDENTMGIQHRVLNVSSMVTHRLIMIQIRVRRYFNDESLIHQVRFHLRM